MKKNSVWHVGMDVHAKTIAVAVAEPDGTVRSVGPIANEAKAVRKLMEKLGSEGRELRVCYEAGPTGYVLYWQLTRMGVACEEEETFIHWGPAAREARAGEGRKATWKGESSRVLSGSDPRR